MARQLFFLLCWVGGIGPNTKGKKQSGHARLTRGVPIGIF